jgi:penicillin-binding protein A
LAIRVGRLARRIWFLPPAALLVFLTLGWRLHDEAALVGAELQLHDGRSAEARPRLARLGSSPWVGPRARAGEALCRALAGEEPTHEGFSTADLRGFQPIPLLESALSRSASGPAVRLAELLLWADEPFARVYRAAALLEAGRETEARRAAEEVLWLLPWHPLGRRLEQALAWRAAGAETLVRDRKGELAGCLDAARIFHREAEVAEAWLPPGLTDALPDRPPLPAGLRLGLDLELARLALSALGPHRGSIVLLDPRSGAVMAAVSDARTYRREPRAAFEQRREPASIAKLITTTAAQRAGLDPDAEIARMTCRGSERYRGGTLWCAYRAGPLSGLDEALAVSCNVAFANLGIRVGREALLDEFRRYGFDAVDGSLLGASGRIQKPPGNERELADLAIGLEATNVTPLHAALMAAVFASDGVMPEPILVTAETGPLGLSSLPPPRVAGRRVLDPSWLPTLRRAMRAVTRYGGTADGLAPPGLAVAMKTGTASEWRHGYHVNYIGFLPAEAPQVAFCIRVTHERNSGRVTRAAREVTATLLSGLAVWLEREASRPRLR